MVAKAKNTLFLLWEPKNNVRTFCVIKMLKFLDCVKFYAFSMSAIKLGADFQTGKYDCTLPSEEKQTWKMSKKITLHKFGINKYNCIF